MLCTHSLCVIISNLDLPIIHFLLHLHIKYIQWCQHSATLIIFPCSLLTLGQSLTIGSPLNHKKEPFPISLPESGPNNGILFERTCLLAAMLEKIHDQHLAHIQRPSRQATPPPPLPPPVLADTSLYLNTVCQSTMKLSFPFQPSKYSSNDIFVVISLSFH